jgi:hypothetical protein
LLCKIAEAHSGNKFPFITSAEQNRRMMEQSNKPVVFRKNLILLKFCPPVMLLSSRVGIRDADLPERSFLSLDDHTEYGDLNFLAPGCLPRVPEYLGPGWREGGPGL